MSNEVCLIERTKVYPTPGRNYRVAWKYNYTVTIPGEQYTFSGDGIGWAKSLCKRKRPDLEIKLAWEA